MGTVPLLFSFCSPTTMMVGWGESEWVSCWCDRVSAQLAWLIRFHRRRGLEIESDGRLM